LEIGGRKIRRLEGEKIRRLEGQKNRRLGGEKMRLDEYSADYYREFLEYVKEKYEGQYWHVLPKDLARFWVNKVVKNN